MSVALFRKLALSMPEAVERAHMGHPDFRVDGRIFASLFYPRAQGSRSRAQKPPAKTGRRLMCGMVKLTPRQQYEFVRDFPGVFEAVAGGWGERGATQVRLSGNRRPAARCFAARFSPPGATSRPRETQAPAIPAT